MRARLPAHFHTALEIRAPLRAQALQGAVSKMVEFYNVHYEMVFPPLNTPPLILKHMRCLGLPGMYESELLELERLLTG